MKSPRAGRTILLVLALLGIVSLLLLAAGLGSVEFHDARQYKQERAEAISFSVAALIEQIASVPMWKQIVFWVGVFFIVLLLSSLLSPEMRKKLLWAIFRLALLALAVFYLVQNREKFGLLPPNPLPEGGPDGAPTPEALTPPTFSPPDLPPALTYLISVAVLLLTFGLIWLISRGFSALRASPAPKASLDEIAAAARQSLDELSAGQNWEDTIVRCYARMSDVVARSRGLHRDESMTPEEFASHLTRSGLPADSIQRLTRLFESVRYGARTAGDRERAEASACLGDILRYCGEAA